MKPTSDLHGLPTSLTNMYCLLSSGEACTQFQEKNSYTLYLATLGATYINYSLTRHVQTLIKSQLHTYLGKEGCLVRLQSSIGYATIRGKTTVHFGSMDSKS